MIESANYSRLQGLRDNLIAAIPTLPDDGYARAELDCMGLSEVVVRYLNWADRFIRPVPRDVYSTAEVLERMDEYPAVREILERLQIGESVNDRLSPTVQTHGYASERYLAQNPRARWRFNDTFLNAFDVHHFHLGQGRSAKRRRSNELLFAEVRREWAGLILVGDHGSFDNGRLAATVAAVRQDSDQLVTMKPPREDQSLREKSVAQRKGMSTTYTVNGRVVLGAFQSLAGGSVRRQHFADRILYNLIHYEDEIIQIGASKWLENRGFFPFFLPLLSWEFERCDLTLLESTTKIQIKLPEMNWIR